MQQLVIKDGFVIATHSPEQDIRDAYPGAEIILHGEMSIGPGNIDPRTREEKRNNYADKRRMEYPSIPDQLNMMFQDQVNDTTTWMEMIQEIKGRYPKPVTK